jgi:hypothetical protein
MPTPGLRSIPAFVTFIANKLSNSATVLYRRKFASTSWTIMSLPYPRDAALPIK